jgi:hypothetical protein
MGTHEAFARLTASMTLRKIIQPLFVIALAVLCLALAAESGSHPASAAAPQSVVADPHCVPIGGTFMTNLGIIPLGDGGTTLGTVTGDLKGAVAATILNVSPGANGTTVFTVHHHIVTEAGDRIDAADATATAAPVPGVQGLLAIVSYPVQIIGGTGKFESATGNFNNIGEVDLAGGKLVLRYTGQVCFVAASNE